MPARDSLLGRILLERSALSPSALREAEQDCDRSGRRLDEVLLRRGLVDESQVAQALAAMLNLDFVAPPLHPDPDALARVQAALARRKGILPLTVEGRRLTVAMANPLDTDAIDDLRFQSGCHVEAVAAPRSAVVQGVLDAYGGELPELLDSLERSGRRDEGRSLQDLENEAGAAPIVKIVDHLLSTAIDRRASDIHIETHGAGSRVRFRIDGLLHTATELPPGSHRAAISRVKVMAGLDISVRRLPQDGGFTVKKRNTKLTVRVSTIPTLGGEKAVLRVLDPGDAPRDLSFLGMAAHDLERLRHLLQRRQGVLLASGPTGSGKTTTLSAAVAELAAGKINIVTLEDPVEYRFPGLAQMEIDQKAGVDFPSGLRAILRQDPDVILVGEVRDRETAEIAMSAAVTGHLVLTTIHTVDAPSAITRLLEMGVPPFLVAGGLAGVIAQRLIRRVCSRCDGRGGECTVCNGGYRGRSGVFEVLVVDDEIRTAITAGAAIASLRHLAQRNGMVSMARDALRQVAEGATTPHEAGQIIALTQGATVRCENCDAALPPAAAGCTMCGRPRGNVCTCGEPIDARWRYCPACQRAVSPLHD
ncbi:MAG: ATPase, T2SS/T4P/T4SS family [Gemmatimonadota bacterium]|nr:ATPase, T2SS/T4P/T4SS family [Gemmatimonadota bacterium]